VLFVFVVVVKQLFCKSTDALTVDYCMVLQKHLMDQEYIDKRLVSKIITIYEGARDGVAMENFVVSLHNKFTKEKVVKSLDATMLNSCYSLILDTTDIKYKLGFVAEYCSEIAELDLCSCADLHDDMALKLGRGCPNVHTEVTDLIVDVFASHLNKVNILLLSLSPHLTGLLLLLFSFLLLLLLVLLFCLCCLLLLSLLFVVVIVVVCCCWWCV